MEDAFTVTVKAAPVVGPPSPVANLSCVAGTDQMTFEWDAPHWSGTEVYAYVSPDFFPVPPVDASMPISTKSTGSLGSMLCTNLLSTP